MAVSNIWARLVYLDPSYTLEIVQIIIQQSECFTAKGFWKEGTLVLWWNRGGSLFSNIKKYCLWWFCVLNRRKNWFLNSPPEGRETLWYYEIDIWVFTSSLACRPYNPVISQVTRALKAFLLKYLSFPPWFLKPGPEPSVDVKVKGFMSFTIDNL